MRVVDVFARAAHVEAALIDARIAKGMTEEAYWHVHPGGAVGSRLGAKFNHSKS